MCFECFKSKPAKGRGAIGFNKHLFSAILKISLMRIMKSSETVGDIPGKKYMIHQWNFFRHSLSLLHLSIRRVFSEVFCILPVSWGACVTSVPTRCWPPQLLGPELPPHAAVCPSWLMFPPAAHAFQNQSSLLCILFSQCCSSKNKDVDVVVLRQDVLTCFGCGIHTHAGV